MLLRNIQILEKVKFSGKTKDRPSDEEDSDKTQKDSDFSDNEEYENGEADDIILSHSKKELAKIKSIYD